MTLEVFREVVKNDGWVIIQKGGYIYFKRRDKTRAYNQGDIYSCHTKNVDEAMQIIKNWIVYGYPPTKKEKEKEKKEDVLFIEYLKSFWDSNSLYFRSAEYEGRHITKTYIEQNKRFIRIYAEDFFLGVKLSQINEKLLNDFFDYLFTYISPKTKRPLARSTISLIKAMILQPLKYGRQKGFVKQSIDFMIVSPNISHKAMRNRGILTHEETIKLLLHKWDEEKAYIAFCIAVNCGLRVGEIRALKIGNIKNGFIIVSNSYNDYDGLKSTKTGKIRITPCPDNILQLIADYIYRLPQEQRESDRFLLTDDFDETKPLYKNYFIKKFYKAMKQCGIERERKNILTGENEYICFHSLRHQTATRWVESGLDLRLIAQAMGHSIDMLEHYSNHFSKDDMSTLRKGLAETKLLGVSENC